MAEHGIGSNESEDNEENENKKPNANQIQTAKGIVCRICMNDITDRSLTDTCLHEFCFECLYQWSQRHNICPFCRQIYHNVICNIRSEQDFDQIPIEFPVANGLNVRTPDDALFGANEFLVQQYSIMRHVVTNQLRQLNRQLASLDQSSEEAHEVMARILEAEQRRDHAIEMIQQILESMGRLNAHHVRVPAVPLVAIDQSSQAANDGQPVDNGVNNSNAQTTQTTQTVTAIVETIAVNGSESTATNLIDSQIMEQSVNSNAKSGSHFNQSIANPETNSEVQNQNNSENRNTTNAKRNNRGGKSGSKKTGDDNNQSSDGNNGNTA